MRGTEKPQMSASRTPTVGPGPARAAARFTVTDDLPDAALARGHGQHPGGAGDRGVRRRRSARLPAGRGHEAAALARRPCAAVSDLTPTPVSRPIRLLRRCSIWPRSGQAAMVRATSTIRRDRRRDRSAPWYMPSSTMSSPSSGSMTPADGRYVRLGVGSHLVQPSTLRSVRPAGLTRAGGPAGPPGTAGPVASERRSHRSAAAVAAFEPGGPGDTTRYRNHPNERSP